MAPVVLIKNNFAFMSRLLQRLPCSLVEHSRASQKTLDALQHDFALYLDYVSEAEQDALVAESRHALKKMDWSDDHFDSVICKYREVVLKDLRRFPVLKSLLNEQIRPAFFTNPEQGLLEPHVLELAGDGHIRPHMDNVPDRGPARGAHRSTVDRRLWECRCFRRE